MSISIHIEGGSVSDIQAQMAALLAGQGRHTELAPETEQSETADPKKPAAKAKVETKPKAETKPKEESKTEAKKPEPETEEVETKADNDDGGDEKTETKAEGEKLTKDKVRDLALDWVNKEAPGDQNKRRELFQELLKKFEAKNLSEIAEDKYEDVVGYINDRVTALEDA